jgi:hypothetical protein
MTWFPGKFPETKPMIYTCCPMPPWNPN